jgi:hypothetical protein
MLLVCESRRQVTLQVEPKHLSAQTAIRLRNKFLNVLLAQEASEDLHYGAKQLCLAGRIEEETDILDVNEEPLV